MVRSAQWIGAARLGRIDRRRGAAAWAFAAAALAWPTGCTPPTLVLGLPEASTGTTDAAQTDTSDTLASSSGLAGSETPTDPTDPPPSCGEIGNACGNKVDVLFVIDNSGTMGEEQLNLAKNFGLLIEQLETLTDADGDLVAVDVNVMVTTTDFSNPACSPAPPGYVPTDGAPVSTPCTERLEQFTSRDGQTMLPEACTDVCDADAPAAPADQFIHFDRFGDNVVGGTPAQALACIGPQGIDGCGYEAPLESMLQALNPDACWNDPSACEGESAWIEHPFLREDAVLTIAIITDEADCSVRDYTIMSDPAFMETHPDLGEPVASSALCWNAGVVCDGLDPVTGEYDGCISANKNPAGVVGVSDAQAVLHPLSRYTALLSSLKASGRVRDVVMLGVLGVPLVDDHADVPPHQPTAGGIEDLVYRRWRDPDVPAGGDILPDEWLAGVNAEDKTFEFGVGPGCTGFDPELSTYTGQAIPPVRIREVCESLDRSDDPDTRADETRIRCCIESICDDDFSPAIRCLAGLIQDVIVPVQ
jgi:hypothetical protein